MERKAAAREQKEREKRRETGEEVKDTGERIVFIVVLCLLYTPTQWIGKEQ